MAAFHVLLEAKVKCRRICVRLACLELSAALTPAVVFLVLRGATATKGLGTVQLVRQATGALVVLDGAPRARQEGSVEWQLRVVQSVLQVQAVAQAPADASIVHLGKAVSKELAIVKFARPDF
jgi:hypothetical protein